MNAQDAFMRSLAAHADTLRKMASRRSERMAKNDHKSWDGSFNAQSWALTMRRWGLDPYYVTAAWLALEGKHPGEATPAERAAWLGRLEGGDIPWLLKIDRRE